MYDTENKMELVYASSVSIIFTSTLIDFSTISKLQTYKKYILPEENIKTLPHLIWSSFW